MRIATHGGPQHTDWHQRPADLTALHLDMSLVPGSGADLDELDCLSQDSIQSELAHWERIVFYGDMEGSSNSRDNGKGKGTLPSTSQSSAPQEEPNLRTFSTVGLGHGAVSHHAKTAVRFLNPSTTHY